MNAFARCLLAAHRTLIARNHAAIAAYKANPCAATEGALIWAMQRRNAVNARRTRR